MTNDKWQEIVSYVLRRLENESEFDIDKERFFEHFGLESSDDIDFLMKRDYPREQHFQKKTVELQSRQVFVFARLESANPAGSDESLITHQTNNNSMNTIKIAVLTFLATCFLGSQAIAGPPYRGAGGQVEAAGIIAGTYLGTAQYIEACEKLPDVKARALKSYREYLERNNQTYMDIMQKLPSIAAANGGDAEVKRLKAELDKGLTYIEENAKKEAAQHTQSAAWCNAFLDKVDKGLLDLKLKHSIEVAKILK